MLIFLQAIKYSTSPGTIFHGWNAQLGWILPSGGPGEASLGRVRHLHLHINFPWHSPKCGVQVKWKNIHFQQSVPTFPMHCFPGKERPRSDRTIYLPFPSSRTFWQRRLQRRGLASTLIVVKKYTLHLWRRQTRHWFFLSSADVNDESVIHTLSLLHPKLEAQLLLAKQVQIFHAIDSKRELGNELSCEWICLKIGQTVGW